MSSSNRTGDARADVLLVTATGVETRAVLEAFGWTERRRPESIAGRVYFDLGTVNGARVRMTQSAMGAGDLGASQQTVSKGIAALSPAAVVMVGIAFGMDEGRQHLGDVLVAEQLRPYELQRVGVREDGTAVCLPRGDKPHASPWLLQILRSAEIAWEGAPVQFGVVLTGAKLVDDLAFRERLRAFEPEAIGGEMEGAGLYVACHDQKVDWILVKAICDFADGHKGRDKEARQALAAKNAATFVHHALRFVEIDWSAGAGRGAVAARPPSGAAVATPARPESIVELRSRITSGMTPAELRIFIGETFQDVEGGLDGIVAGTVPFTSQAFEVVQYFLRRNELPRLAAALADRRAKKPSSELP